MAKITVLIILCLAGILAAKRGGPGKDSSESSEPPSTSSSSTSQTSTATSPSPSTTMSATGNLTFSQPGNTTTCGSTTFSWIYQGNTIVPLTIQIANPPSESFAENLTSNLTLTTDLPSNANSFTWDPVDIGEGVYTVAAFDSLQVVSLFAQSTPFFITTSNDTSCLTNATSTSTTSSSQSTSPSPSPSSGESTSSSKGVDPKALAGAIVGAVGAVVVIGLALVAPQWLRHHLPHRNRRNVRAGGPYYLF